MLKIKKNPARTVDATERTRFSKSRPNDLEDIGQGQRSSHATHPLMLLIICTKYGKNPSWTVDATGRTRKVNGQTDRQTDRQTDGRTDRVNPIYPPNFAAGGIKMHSFSADDFVCDIFCTFNEFTLQWIDTKELLKTLVQLMDCCHQWPLY